MFASLKSALSPRNSTPMILAALAITIFMLGFNYYVHFPLAKNAEERELRTVSTLLDGYARQVEEQMVGIETTLAALASVVSNDSYSNREKHLILKQAADALDIVRVFGVTDTSGKLILSSRNYPAPDLDLSHRDFINHFLNGSMAPRFLSGPVKNLVDGRWQISLSQAIRSPDGEITGVISTVVDPGTMIDRIAASANELDYITLLDRDFNLVARQPAKEEMIGKSMASAQIYTDVASDPDARVANSYANVFTGEVRFGVAERVFHDSLVISTSRPYDYAMRFWSVFSSSTTIGSFVVFCLLIATLWFINLRAVATLKHNQELQAVNKDLQIARTEAEKLASIKEEFLANMSHEIRTPMNAIFGLTQLLKRTPLEHQQQEYVRQIGLSGKFLLGVIDEILTFSKIEADELVLDVEPFVLPDIIDNVGSIMAMAVKDKPIETIIDVARDVPRSVRGDSQRLQQVLVNLVSNAIKFTESGEVKLSVKKTPHSASSDFLTFSVSDTGIGISEAHQKTIFDPFTQADASTTRKFGGTGLGLAISKRLATAMGGEIELKSVPGAGSTFSFSVPLQPGPTDIAQPLGFEEQNDMRVLIVDDHEQTREALKTIAESLYISADTAPDGKSALEMLVNSPKPYDILMIDWQMPGLDGLETIKQIPTSRLEKMPSIVLVTAYERELLAQVPDVKDVKLLTKPVTGSSFFDTVAEVSGQQATIRSGSSTPVKMAPDTLTGYDILIAEDNLVNQQVAKELLISLGADVEIAENGVEAVEAIKHNTYDVILMDVQMPKMTGIEATQHIRASYPDLKTPIIALTAGVLDDEQRKCREAGMDDFVGKPFDFDLIVSKIVEHARKEKDVKHQSDPRNALPENGHPPNSSSTNETVLHDRNKAIELVAGNEQLYLRLCQLFVSIAKDTKDQINLALSQDDSDAVSRHLHSLKGSSAQIAAVALTQKATELESFAINGDLASIKKHADAFDKLIEDTVDAVSKELDPV